MCEAVLAALLNEIYNSYAPGRLQKSTCMRAERDQGSFESCVRARIPRSTLDQRTSSRQIQLGR